MLIALGVRVFAGHVLLERRRYQYVPSLIVGLEALSKIQTGECQIG